MNTPTTDSPSGPNRAGQKSRPTMEDVADRAGVSRSLVSLVMRDSPKVSEASREAVLAAAEQLGYQANLLASTLASQRTYTIGVVLNDLHNLYFADIYDGIFESAQTADYRLVMNGGRGKAEAEARAIANFVSLRVEGIVAVGAQISDAEITSLVGPSQTPVVVVGRGGKGPLIDSVRIDDARGARMAVTHLAELGHRRIAHLDGGTGAGADDRRRSYLETMESLGLAHYQQVAASEFNELSGYEGAARLMGSALPPTAIFAANDLNAIGALDWLLNNDYAIPDDVSVIGFDNISLAAMRHLSLTTIHQPRREMGEQAMKLLFERIDGRDLPDHYIAEPTLTIRTTTGPAPVGSDLDDKDLL